MNQPLHPFAGRAAVSGRLLPVLLALFVGSGCSALIYEVVWFQQLQLVIGSTAISLGVLLATFMGGMCLGSLLLTRLVSTRPHPLRVYAALELGIGVLGLVLLVVIPYIGQVYLSTARHGMTSMLFRAALGALCLLPPTVLMGATLPAIARWMETTRDGMARLGFFYGANIAGAVIGCLLAGFYLLRVHDIYIATYTAVVMNLVIALLGYLVAYVAAYRDPGTAGRGATWSDRWTVYLAIGISGCAALACEVIWTRQLSLLLGATVYTFSIILAMFLVGLGVGSSVGSFWARSCRDAGLALAGCQAGLALAVWWSSYAIAQSLPFWPIDPALTSNPWIVFQLDLVRAAWCVVPAAFLWGASFPLALAAVCRQGEDAGRLVSGVYACNTLGAIVGSVVCSMLAVAWLGTQVTQQIVIGISFLAAALLLVPRLRRAASVVSDASSQLAGDAVIASRYTAFGLLVVATVGSGWLAWQVPAVPRGLIGYGRVLAVMTELPEFTYVGEGINASIAISEFSDGTRNFHVSGKVVASTEPQDMRLQRMLGHIPALLHPQPKAVLVVGCGAGVTAGSFLVHPGVQRVVICEIEPLIPPAAAKYFGRENYDVVTDPRVEIVYDDARHFIITTNERFDIITSDPIHPWVKGAAALYSKQYYDLCKQKLNPGGIVTQWVPLYETNLPAVKSEIATFFEAYPGGTVWSNENSGFGYDVVMLGHREPTIVDLDQMQQRWQNDDHRQVVQSLDEVGFSSLSSVLLTYAGRHRDLTTWLADAELNHDTNLRLQYLAGMGLNSYVADDILQSMLAYWNYPDDLFKTSGPTGAELKLRLLLNRDQRFQ